MAKGGNGNLKLFAGLSLGLLFLMVLVGMTFVVDEKFKEQICETGGLTYNASTSTTNCNGTAYTPITYFVVVESALITLIGFVGIVVIVMIVKLIIKTLKGLGDM